MKEFFLEQQDGDDKNPEYDGGRRSKRELAHWLERRGSW